MCWSIVVYVLHLLNDLSLSISRAAQLAQAAGRIRALEEEVSLLANRLRSFTPRPPHDGWLQSRRAVVFFS